MRTTPTILSGSWREGVVVTLVVVLALAGSMQGPPAGADDTPELVADINPSGDSAPAVHTDVGDTLFFRADDGTNGRELWASDGTETGTRMVKDINPSGGSFPSVLINVGGTLFFTADDGTNGEAGAHRLVVSGPAPDGSRQEVSAAITVVAVRLPNTGVGVGSSLLVAFGLLTLGEVLLGLELLASRRRVRRRKSGAAANPLEVCRPRSRRRRR